MNRVLPADFVRVRREVLQPEYVGLPRGRTTQVVRPTAGGSGAGPELLIFSAVPGSPSHEKLRSLAPACA